MSLPVLPSSAFFDPAHLLRLYVQADCELSLPLGEDHVLDAGRAVVNAKLGAIRDANAIFNAIVVNSPRQTVDDVEQFFTSQNAACLKWSLREPSASLEEELRRRGYFASAAQVWHLKEAPPLQIDPNVQVIPARASFRHARELADELSYGANPQITEAFMHRLDDPRIDCLLVMDRNRAVARIMVLSMGEVGVLTSLNVLPDQRGRGRGTLLVNRAMELCERAMFKHVMTEIESCDSRGQALYTSMGFAPLGAYTTFVKSAPVCAV